MRNYEDFLKIECKVMGYKNITRELFEAREKYCYRLSLEKCKGCMINYKYYSRGMSCNDALNRYPNKCMEYFSSMLDHI